MGNGSRGEERGRRWIPPNRVADMGRFATLPNCRILVSTHMGRFATLPNCRILVSTHMGRVVTLPTTEF